MRDAWTEVKQYEHPYSEWRAVVSEIATKQYKDPYGQDPTSKLGEDYWEELFAEGKTPEEALDPNLKETHD